MAQTLFASFGIKKERIILADKDLYFDQLIIPSPLFLLNLTAAPEQLLVYQQIKSAILKGIALAPANRKIYLSRRLLGNKKRKAINEEDIEMLFSQKGFEIVFPEQLSLQSQIQLMSETNIISGCEGSALHMSLFLPQSASMIIVSSKNAYLSQLIINSLVNTKTYVINAGKNGLTSNQRSWEANIEFVKDKLDNIMHHLDGSS